MSAAPRPASATTTTPRSTRTAAPPEPGTSTLPNQDYDPAAARALRAHAEELVAAGAGMLLLEMVPATLAAELTKALPVPVIGIGAGAGCSGQVLVLHDMLGMTNGEPFRFVRNFMDGSSSIELAVRNYVIDVKGGRFPNDALHSF